MKSKRTIKIGVDFDNTIVNYDNLFRDIALEKKLLPESLPATKSNIRDYLRSIDREDDWTRLQGYVYGTRMPEADMFPGVLDFLQQSREWEIEVFIISHRTKEPYLGPRCNLHKSAIDWIEINGFYDPGRTGLRPEQIFFESSRRDKLRRIAKTMCSIFLDDLPECLAEPEFPANVERVLFDPEHAHTSEKRFLWVSSWKEFTKLVGKRLEENRQ